MFSSLPFLPRERKSSANKIVLVLLLLTIFLGQTAASAFQNAGNEFPGFASWFLQTSTPNTQTGQATSSPSSSSQPSVQNDPPSVSLAKSITTNDSGFFGDTAGVAIDGNGNAFVTDYYNQRVQVFAPNGTFLYMFNVSNPGKFTFYPHAIAINPINDTIYVVGYCFTGSCIYPTYTDVEEFSAVGVLIGAWGDNCQNAYSVAVDSKGYVYTANSCPSPLEKFTANGAFVQYIGQGGSGARNTAITVSGKYLYVARGVYYSCTANQGFNTTYAPPGCTFQKFTLNGIEVEAWGNTNNFTSAYGIAVDGSGNIYLADTYNNRLLEYHDNGNDTVGTFVASFGSEGQGSNQFMQPDGIFIGRGGNLWVADSENDRVQEFGVGFSFLGTLGGKASFYFSPNYQGQIYPANNGDIYVADTFPNGGGPHPTETNSLGTLFTISEIDQSGNLLFRTNLDTSSLYLPASMSNIVVNQKNTTFYLIFGCGSQCLPHSSYIAAFNSTGSVLAAVGPPPYAYDPTGLVINNNGYIYSSWDGEYGPFILGYNSELAQVSNFSTYPVYGDIDGTYSALAIDSSGYFHLVGGYQGTLDEAALFSPAGLLEYAVPFPPYVFFNGPVATDDSGDTFYMSGSQLFVYHANVQLFSQTLQNDLYDISVFDNSTLYSVAQAYPDGGPMQIDIFSVPPLLSFPSSSVATIGNEMGTNYYSTSNPIPLVSVHHPINISYIIYPGQLYTNGNASVTYADGTVQTMTMNVSDAFFDAPQLYVKLQAISASNPSSTGFAVVNIELSCPANFGDFGTWIKQTVEESAGHWAIEKVIDGILEEVGIPTPGTVIVIGVYIAGSFTTYSLEQVNEFDDDALNNIVINQQQGYATPLKDAWNNGPLGQEIGKIESLAPNFDSMSPQAQSTLMIRLAQYLQEAGYARPNIADPFMSDHSPTFSQTNPLDQQSWFENLLSGSDSTMQQQYFGQTGELGYYDPSIGCVGAPYNYWCDPAHRLLPDDKFRLQNFISEYSQHFDSNGNLLTSCVDQQVLGINLIDPSGTISSAQTHAPIEGAQVTLFMLNTTANSFQPVNDTSLFSPATNPETTIADGGYAWLVVSGEYFVHITAYGYYPANSSIVTVPPAVTNLNVALTPAPHPNTTLSITSGTLGNNDWYTSPTIKITLASNDSVGLQSIDYMIDGGTEQLVQAQGASTFLTSFNLSGDGVHNVTYWSVGSDGFVELKKSQLLQVDSSLPNVTISVPQVNTSVVTPSILVSDTISGLVQASATLDGQPYGIGTPINSTGQHTLTVTAIDFAGNTMIQSVSFTVAGVTFTEFGLPAGTTWGVTFDGQLETSTSSTITFQNIPAGTYSWNVSTPIYGRVGVRYVAGTASGTMSDPGQTSQSISFTTQFEVTVTSSPSGGGTTSPSGTAWYNADSTLSLSATPSNGYRFVSWINNTSSIRISNNNSASTSATINGTGTLTSSFAVTIPIPELPLGQISMMLATLLALGLFWLLKRNSKIIAKVAR